MYELSFTMTNLNCDACINVSTKALQTIPGITEVTIDLATGKAHIASNEPIEPDVVTGVLKEKGYTIAL